MCHAVITFRSQLGWVALSCRSDTITGITFGYDSAPDAIRGLDCVDFEVRRARGVEREWVERIRAFAQGQQDALLDLPLDYSRYTPFQRAVIEQCRHIAYGDTVTYGKLAERAGAPRAARAVGNVMRTNRYPLVVPCHRVVASGSLGGYSSRQGLSMKKRLLDMESREKMVAGVN